MNPGTEEGDFQFSHIKGPGGRIRLRAGGSKETVPFLGEGGWSFSYENTAVSTSCPCGGCL